MKITSLFKSKERIVEATPYIFEKDKRVEGAEAMFEALFNLKKEIQEAKKQKGI